MRTRYKALTINPDISYFVTSTIVGRIPVFTCTEHFEIILRSLEYLRTNHGMKLFAYVIMDNHMHLILSSEDLPKTMQSLKSFTSKQLIASFRKRNMDWLLNELMRNKARYKDQSHYQLWQEGYHPEEITTNEMFIQKMDYIHNNPVKRGFVTRPEYWVYSSAACILAGAKGIIELDLLPV